MCLCSLSHSGQSFYLFVSERHRLMKPFGNICIKMTQKSKIAVKSFP